MDKRNSITRFSERADNYQLYRPGYPSAIVDYLEQSIGLDNSAIVADIGAGTGIFSSLFLEAGYEVSAVEPNVEMRRAASKNLETCEDFKSIDGTAENTGLPNQSVDLITAAQAFHWFNQEKVKKEFKRILKPRGHVLLVWNILQKNNPFLVAYAALKEKYADDLVHPVRANLDNISHFFYPQPVIAHTIPNTQILDAAGLEGYLLSFSTVPLKGDERYNEMMVALKNLVDQHAENGLMKMEYSTRLYLAKWNNGHNDTLNRFIN